MPNFEGFVALRYVRAKRRNSFISFISLISILGMALGVMALITVLSVMNGFEKELKERILGMASHATIIHNSGFLENWETISRQAIAHPKITAAAPFFRAEGMLDSGHHTNGIILHGVLPEKEVDVSTVNEKMVTGSFHDLKPGKFGIIIGQEAAKRLAVHLNDEILLITPKFQSTPAGILPRLKQFTVVGIFQVGMYEFDNTLGFIHLDDALRLFQSNGPSGLRLKTTNLLTAPVISRTVANTLPGNYRVIDWTQRHANFFKALKTEKTAMFIILTLIITVATFNIIATLMMVVADKQADIAVLRTLGASPSSIMKIFILQGLIIGSIGILIGNISGIWLANTLGTLIASIERFFNMQFLPADIYYINELPVDMQWTDIMIISTIAFIFCLSSTIYPAFRAAKIQPAEALRYE